MKRALLITMVICLAAASAGSQTLWLDRSADNTLQLAIAKGSYDDAPDFDLLTVSAWLSARFTVSENFAVVGGIPYTRVGIDDYDGSEGGIGNLYLGGEYMFASGKNFFEFGIFLPTVSDDNDAMEIFWVNDYANFEGILPDYTTFRVYYNHNLQLSEMGGLRFRIGPSFFMASDDGGDSETAIDWAAIGSIQADKLTLQGGFFGRYAASEDNADFSEKSESFFTVRGEIDANGFVPSLGIHIPIEERWSEIVNAVFTFGFGYRF